VAGFSVRSGVAAPADHRKKLDQLRSHISRPAVLDSAFQPLEWQPSARSEASELRKTDARKRPLQVVASVAPLGRQLSDAPQQSCAPQQAPRSGKSRPKAALPTDRAKVGLEVGLRSQEPSGRCACTPRPSVDIALVVIFTFSRPEEQDLGTHGGLHGQVFGGYGNRFVRKHEGNLGTS
jgi:hypothetical protein